jgi:ribosomal-protein-alanine N-acetyltransferase
MSDEDEIISVPSFETKRLVLRNIKKEEIPFILKHFGRDEVNEFSDYDSITKMEEAEEFYEKFFKPDRPLGFRQVIVLKETDELIGTIGLFRWSMKDKRAEIGYDLVPEFWGQGIMTEALGPILEFGFDKMGLNRIDATSNTENIRSHRVLEKAGFKKEGVMREKYFYKGKFQDDAIYSLLMVDWR